MAKCHELGVRNSPMTTDPTVYLDGRGIDEHLAQLGPKKVTAYITDHLGTVINGEALGKKRAVGAFGEPLASGENHGDNNGKSAAISKTSDPAQYGFAGRQFDPESNLYYNRARMYDPSTGRFLSMDPIGLRGGTTNLFEYTKNNPLRYLDSNGKNVGTLGYVIIVAATLAVIYIAWKADLPGAVKSLYDRLTASNTGTSPAGGGAANSCSTRQINRTIASDPATTEPTLEQYTSPRDATPAPSSSSETTYIDKGGLYGGDSGLWGGSGDSGGASSDYSGSGGGGE